MEATQCMYGKRVRYGITYKQNERSFNLYRRKYMHNLKVCINNKDMEGAFACLFDKYNCMLVAKIDEVFIFDSHSYQLKDKLPIKLLPTTAREPNEIIGMAKSEC